MNKEFKEALSKFMDDEAVSEGRENAAEHLCNDAHARDYWKRMHIVRDVVQKEFNPSLLDGDFSSRISAALADEPIPKAESNVVSADFQQPGKRKIQWQRPLGGLAIAATVAAVSVMGLRYLQPSDPASSGFDQRIAESSTPVNAELLTPPVGINAAQTPGEGIRLVNNRGTYWTLDKQRVRNSDLEQRLNGYLSDHIEFATIRNVGGMLPYSRLVGYDEARP